MGDGSVERYKARLVAKGFNQKYGVDYNETFAPVVQFDSLRLLLAFAATYDMEIHQLDVKTAFLNGDLDEEIFMSQPPAIESSDSNASVSIEEESLWSEAGTTTVELGD